MNGTATRPKSRGSGTSPSALESFIAIADGNSRSPYEQRLESLALILAGTFFFLFVFVARFRVEFQVGTALSVIVLLLTKAHVERQTVFGKSRRRVISELNRVRIREGLHAFLGHEALHELDIHARYWEQIEAGLQSSNWRTRAGLRFRIESAAEQAMIDLIVLRTADHLPLSVAERRTAWDRAALKLQNLVQSVLELENSLFVYPRSSELVADVELPSLSAVTRLEEVLEA